MYITGQKTGMIPIFTLIIFIILYYVDRRRIIRLILIFPILLYTLNKFFTTYINFSLDTALEYVVARFTRVGSFTRRFELKDHAFDLFTKNPLFGSGQDGFQILYGTNNPHDWNFQILAETGIIGFVFYIMILFYLVQLLSKYGSTSLVMLTSIIYLTVTSAGGSNFSAHPFWVVMALLYYYTKNNYYQINKFKSEVAPSM